MIVPMHAGCCFIGLCFFALITVLYVLLCSCVELSLVIKILVVLLFRID